MLACRKVQEFIGWVGILDSGVICVFFREFICYYWNLVFLLVKERLLFIF